MREKIDQAGISGVKLKSRMGDAARPKIVNQESRSYFCESSIAIQSCWNHSNVPEQFCIPPAPMLTFKNRLFGPSGVRSKRFPSFSPDRFATFTERSGSRSSVREDLCWAVIYGHRCGCLTTPECPVSIRIVHDSSCLQMARSVNWSNEQNLFSGSTHDTRRTAAVD